MEDQIALMQQGARRTPIPDFCTCLSSILLSWYPASLRKWLTWQPTCSELPVMPSWPSWVVYDQNFWQEMAGKPLGQG